MKGGSEAAAAAEGKGEEFVCTHPGCVKSYTSRSGYRAHLKTHQKGQPETSEQAGASGAGGNAQGSKPALVRE